MYNYQEMKPTLFTEENQAKLLQARDKIKELLATAGAFRADKIINLCKGDSWTILAIIDRMVEIKELMELTGPKTWGQYRVFTSYCP